MNYYTEANFGIEECKNNHLLANTIMLTCECIYGLDTGLPLYPKNFVEMMRWHQAGIIRKGKENDTIPKKITDQLLNRICRFNKAR